MVFLFRGVKVIIFFHFMVPLYSDVPSPKNSLPF